MENGDTAFSDKDKTQCLADTFLSSHKTSLALSSEHSNVVKKSIDTLKKTDFSINNDDLTTTDQLKLLIKLLKIKKASGYDEISNILIKNIPECAISLIVKIFNACLEMSYFPSLWKIGKVIALPKPNKDLKVPSNYRPITLLPCIGKLLEKVIMAKIVDFETMHSILIPHQFGFRSGHSTTHRILSLTEEISFDFNKTLSTGMVLLDVEKAFDCVWHEGLLHKMMLYKFPIHIVKLIQSYLQNRKSFVHLNRTSSKSYEIPAGVPQGSIISPHLFNIFLNDIPDPPNCVKGIYADDTILKTTSGSHGISNIKQNLENGLKIIEKYFNSWKIKINHAKTEAIVFTHSHIINRCNDNFKINFGGVQLDWKSNVKYLGVILDSKLLF
jgi:hypothetical protein